MKAMITHSSINYLMTPEQAAEVLALVVKYGTEVWVSEYQKDADTNKYVTVYKVLPAPSPFVDVRPLEISCIPDEAYGLAKMRYQAGGEK